ncbi:MAG: glycoside hydrolase family 172 protein, partial [Planctomycetota bacterium]
MKRLIVTLAILTLSVGCATTITTESLLNDMTDLHRLTKLPSPAYTTKQFSSYDRKSKIPDDHDGWFANGDRGQYLRVEEKDGRKEHVMMDADGPGAIVRIWSANPEGTLRIYLDRSDKPVIESDMKKLLKGEYSGLPHPIAGVRAKGWNLYFPIPYAQHCKVTSDKGKFYYHVNYRTYQAGTRVTSYTADDLNRLQDKIQGLANKLSAPLVGDASATKGTESSFEVNLNPGDEEILLALTGPKAINRLVAGLSATDRESAARSVVLYMSFDGEKTVECPLGDFFGVAPGLIPYASVPLGITKGAPLNLGCRWQMPFRKSAKVTAKNLGNQKVRVQGNVLSAPYKWDSQSLLFHAKWRIERDIPTRPFSDWAHLECTGNGRFVGGMLNILNPVRRWWGEGDEKIYVDGEKFPSHFGTGTEDYYGYAWCSPELFVHAYHNQPRCDGPGNYGHSSVNRFHIIDDIPFRKQFKFDIENWHSTAGIKTTRAAVSYWYARPGGTDFFKTITPKDVILDKVKPYLTFHVEGAIEG